MTKKKIDEIVSTGIRWSNKKGFVKSHFLTFRNLTYMLHCKKKLNNSLVL